MCTILFYVIIVDFVAFVKKNMNIVNLFADSSFLFLATLNLYCIDLPYQFE